MKYHHTRGTLTPENLLELDPKEDQLGVEHEQTPLDLKTKAWVDEQNKISKEKVLGHDGSCKEIKDTRHPDPRIGIEPSTKSLKRGTVITSEKDTPQPTRALQEFVKHIADPLVNKGWEFGFEIWAKESPRKRSLLKALLHGSPQLKLTEKKKLVNPK